MAAIDLERGLEHGRRGWGAERTDTMEDFDSEMQEWEDQLQDIQRKIEELYSEVQARRGRNGVTVDGQDNVKDGPGYHDNGIFAPVHQNPRHPSNGLSYPASHQNGISEIGDLLQDYLGRGEHANRKNNGARHVHFSDTIKVSQDESRRTANQRVGPEQFLCSFEESENRKNRPPDAKSCLKEHSATKPPLGQKELASVASPPRFTAQLMTAESPTLDRKSYGLCVLSDRKCGSPSILRKFGAMLQENEGKMLTDTGVVLSEIKCHRPRCQPKVVAAGPGKTSLQKWSSEADHGASEPARHHHRDLRAGSQARSQVPGSPRTRPRSNSAADRERVRKPTSHHGEPNTDSGIQRSRLQSQSDVSACWRDEGLITLLDMLDIQHEYTSRAGHTAYKTHPQQINTPQWSSEPKTSFSRPARPANQRPPSRWASRTPSARIAVPLGPKYRPQSPLIHASTTKNRTPSPFLKHRPASCSPSPAETVIM
ncbi:uncharacterized protein KIAA0408-like [Syngnathoides biaculeatus]|uniref:uncharacterized protein KIAA0408-like n=1 Tax=Syngnathoides biaculeatus TaxID=300417 RepID=UPI002ADDED94|nr:uncharacterized protein KIAA0408-like [Syngnathoides biaculeatus]